MRSGIRERTIAGNYAKLGGKRKPTTGYDDAVSVIIDTFPKVMEEEGGGGREEEEDSHDLFFFAGD